MRHPRPAPSHAPTIQRRPEPAAADLAPADDIPPEHRIDPVIRLTPAQAERVADLVANPPEPTEHLRRLMVNPPPGAWWNGIARAWMVAGPDGAPVRCDPQPMAPGFSPIPDPFSVFVSVPPAVKVSA
mgnify:FL=1